MPARRLAVKRAVRHGVDIIYHCDFADDEALDMLEGVKDRIFTGPAFSLIVNRLESLRGDNTPRGRVISDRLKALYDASCGVHVEMRKRGIRILVGGDYGFADNPQGNNARDLELLRDAFRLQPERGAAGRHPHRRRGDAAPRTSSGS